MKFFELKNGRTFLLKLEYGRGIIEQLVEFLFAKKIETAYLSGIGAVKMAEIGYYDQERKEYVKRKIEEPMELLSLTGNVSLRDGKPFCHVHVVLGKDSMIYAGHLFDAEVFACEIYLVELEGKVSRSYDEQTGLYLWT
ncbi:MAG: DNA-binding protein [Archaeoglobales archaeon]|nr:DNA-binding protein [Archaeoglobales archaeon]